MILPISNEITPLRFGRGDRETVGDRSVSDSGAELCSILCRYRTHPSKFKLRLMVS